ALYRTYTILSRCRTREGRARQPLSAIGEKLEGVSGPLARPINDPGEGLRCSSTACRSRSLVVRHVHPFGGLAGPGDSSSYKIGQYPCITSMDRQFPLPRSASAGNAVCRVSRHGRDRCSRGGHQIAMHGFACVELAEETVLLALG